MEISEQYLIYGHGCLKCLCDMKKVAIIGAGASGLAAAKACKEEGIDYVCFEKSGRFGGLWNYHEDDSSAMTSVMKSTVINSSKEMSAFSDFPPPKEFPNYMHNRQMLKYFQMYAEEHSLLEKLQYYQEVTSVVPTKDYDETGRWIVTTRDTENGIVTEKEFDGVMICTGHHGYPYTPKFIGQESFKGKVIHTHSLKVPDAYVDQRVLVIGVGNSGLDAAVDISNVAKQVYLSTRRGTWVMFRLGKHGLPVDLQLLNRMFAFLQNIVGRHISSAYMERLLNQKFDHAVYHLKPKHRFTAQHLAINDHLPNKILSGTIIVKGDVQRFVEKGVVFQGDNRVTRVDTIILATGYKIKFPFISEDILKVNENQVELYKYMFPSHLKHPTLAVIGLIQPFGSLFPIMECQSRWFAQLLSRKVSLPGKEIMVKDIKEVQERLTKRYVGSRRHTIQVDYVTYMDDVASQFGAKPNLLKMALTDPVLFYHCVFGPCVPYQYRLEGPHSWAGARRAIVTTHDRVTVPLNTRAAEPRDFINLYTFIWMLSFFILCGALYIVSLCFS